ncbi:hypothetical protein KC726_02655 [Candidatus Woesebacteria bacterium]|nr:hypothetical protein [Candidatus Woesebacteria bacterium]
MKSFHAALSVIGIGLLLLFVVLNIIFSQYMPGYYYSFVNGDQQAVVEYFRRARRIPFFVENILPQTFDRFEQNIKEIYAFDFQREQTIAEYENVLKLNPSSRDVHLILAELYAADGNSEQAQFHLHQAQNIDPKAVPFQSL